MFSNRLLIQKFRTWKAHSLSDPRLRLFCVNNNRSGSTRLELQKDVIASYLLFVCNPIDSTFFSKLRMKPVDSGWLSREQHFFSQKHFTAGNQSWPPWALSALCPLSIFVRSLYWVWLCLCVLLPVLVAISVGRGSRLCPPGLCQLAVGASSNNFCSHPCKARDLDFLRALFFVQYIYIYIWSLPMNYPELFYMEKHRKNMFFFFFFPNRNLIQFFMSHIQILFQN